MAMFVTRREWRRKINYLSTIALIAWTLDERGGNRAHSEKPLTELRLNRVYIWIILTSSLVFKTCHRLLRGGLKSDMR